MGRTDVCARRIAATATSAVPFVQALAIWAVSRIVVFLGVVIGRGYLPLNNPLQLGEGRWYHALLRWDSEWYLRIVDGGYAYDGDPLRMQSVVFYPLYPLVSRMVRDAVGLSSADAILLVANLSAVVGILLMFRLVRDLHGHAVALSCVALMSFFPTSYFLSAGYTESLLLALATGFFLALRADRFFVAACLAAAASATRSSGVMLAPVLAFALWRAEGLPGKMWRLPLWTLLGCAGFLAYVAWLGAMFGHPLAFAEGQSAFHEGTTMLQRFVSALTLQPILRFAPSEFTPAGFDQWYFLLFGALLAYRIRTGLDPAMTLYAALVLLLPYLTLCGGPAGLTSMGRFNIVSFPLFIAFALLIGSRPIVIACVIGPGAGLLALLSALFSRWHWTG